MTQANKPQFLVKTVREYRSGNEIKQKWLTIGTAWLNSNGDGYNITLDAVPLDNRLFLTPFKEQEEAVPASEPVAQAA